MPEFCVEVSSTFLSSTRGSFLTKKQDQAARKIMRFLRRCRHRYSFFLLLDFALSPPLPHLLGALLVSSDSFFVSLQDEGTKAEPRARRSSPTRISHLTSLRLSHHPEGRFLQS